MLNQQVPALFSNKGEQPRMVFGRRPGEPLAPNAISEIFGALADRMRQVVDVVREGARQAAGADRYALGGRN